MSREIKFRAWSNEHNRYCDLIKMDEDDRWYGYIYSCAVYLSTKDIILEQYTGIKDKNGKEIYEGDVIESWYLNGDGNGGYYDAGNFEVVFKNGAFGVTRKDEFYTFDEIEWDELKDIKVIGNIHKDKKLLGGKK